jgi:hypothetical protein
VSFSEAVFVQNVSPKDRGSELLPAVPLPPKAMCLFLLSCSRVQWMSERNLEHSLPNVSSAASELFFVPYGFFSYRLSCFMFMKTTILKTYFKMCGFCLEPVKMWQPHPFLWLCKPGSPS